MIDYFSYKKIYTEGDLFTLSGKDFVGNVQYKDGIATNYDTGETLEPKNTFATDLFTSNYFKDRTINDKFISLPISESECTFSLNETLNFKSFKYKLEQLKNNNTFVFSQLFIASNRLPVAESITYDAINTETNELDNYKIGLGEAVFGNPDFLTAPEDSDLNALGYVEDITAQTNYDFSDRFALFCAAGNSFISLTGDSDGLSIVEKSEEYESTPNNIQKFGRVSGITSNSKSLFISDTIENIVIKYDITGYVNNDTALANIRYLTSVMGGTGFTDRRSNFNNPTKLACTEDRLAVYDSSNECVKIYNTDFDYLTTLTFINLRKAKGGIETFSAMAFDPHFKNLYILTTTNTNNIVLYRADINTRDIEVVKVADVLGDDEVVRSITFSQTDSNYWYYSTNKRIFKKYKTRPNVTSVGSYDEERLGDIRSVNIGSTSDENRWNRQNTTFNKTVFPWNFRPTTTTITTTDVGEGLAIPGQKFRAFNIVPGLPGNEKILLFTKSRIYHFDEPVTKTYQKVINKENYENYGINGFSLSPDEYIQPAVLNSELYKLIYDLLTLKNNIVGRFAGRYNYKNELVLDNYNYNIDFASLKRENIEDYFIHHNEESIVGALNRIFKQVYELQRFVVSAIQVDIGAQVREIEISDQPPVEQKANLVLTKEIVDQQEKYFVGDTVKYRVTLSNNGNITAPGVRLQDSLQGIVITQDQRGILTSNVDVNVGDVIEATYTYTLVEPGQLTNSIVAVGDNPASSGVTIDVDSDTDLVFSKTLVNQPGIINVGTVLSYKLEVTNNGAVASNILVEDSEQGSIENVNGDLFDGIATLAEGDKVTTTYDYTVQEKDIGKIVINTATLTAESAAGGAQILLTDTARTGSTTTIPTANLSMTKNIVNEPSEINVGVRLTYQVRVTNSGDGPASDLVLTDSLNIRNIRGTGKDMLTANGLTSLGSNSSVTATYDYVVRESDIGNKINNTATLTATLNATGNITTLTKTKETNTTVTVTTPDVAYIFGATGPEVNSLYERDYLTYSWDVVLGINEAPDRLLIFGIGGGTQEDDHAISSARLDIIGGGSIQLIRATPPNFPKAGGGYYGETTSTIFYAIVPSGVAGKVTIAIDHFTGNPEDGRSRSSHIAVWQLSNYQQATPVDGEWSRAYRSPSTCNIQVPGGGIVFVASQAGFGDDTTILNPSPTYIDYVGTKSRGKCIMGRIMPTIQGNLTVSSNEGSSIAIAVFK